MNFTFVGFNYQSGDLEAEERNYLGHHVGLVKTLPGLRQYYTGRTIEHRGEKPTHFRHAILRFDDPDPTATASQTPAGAAIASDTEAHLKDVRYSTFAGDIIVPFENRKPGQKCFLMTAEFNLDKAKPEAAEKRYREHHTSIARRLPGLRNYLIGKLGAKADRYRIAILAFDSAEAFKEAYKSSVGAELIKDENETIHDARVLRFDARVEV
jgi:uncharacterized protein (TIGR02118 family)